MRSVVLQEMIPLLEWSFLGNVLELLFMNSIPVTERICYILQCMQQNSMNETEVDNMIEKILKQ